MKKTEGRWWFWVGTSLLAIPGLLHAWLLMPFPGSQDLNAFRVSFYLEKIVLPLRIAGALMILWYCFKYYSTNTLAGKIVKPLLVIMVVGSFYFTDLAYEAEKMFAEPQVIRFVNAKDNVVPENFIIIGVESNGVAKAYPLVYLGYHHKVQDNVGTLPVWLLTVPCGVPVGFIALLSMANAKTSGWWARGIIMQLLKMKTPKAGGTRPPVLPLRGN